ncbi:DUF2784 domain-containing protein [Persicimonas caeni]|uniref:DUF2784 domain-containing protein n=1 Tax=Persicimonas caeni TaxID=2292766 RepID=A0A4Y6PP74_PERCE|nr:DUF2784 domain-containing protein [Persicimonas caeni]QDG49605.1 DUF2784 domain-containing protein [Persicimonas caeni]QED30826.1 DUF2784 domain-containing protein [Persicimonas caeni]
MLYKLGAEIIVVLHLAFILFIIFGGLLALRWPRASWVHLPCALYGVLIEWVGWVCPLTPWENALRERAGGEGYEGDFIEHYLLPIIYPSGLTPTVQLVLGALVIVVNVAIYAFVIWKWRKDKTSQT